MEEYFFREQQIQKWMQNNHTFILHCEHSQRRAPNTYRLIRELDRQLNLENYPLLFFPEIYILEGGYKQFYINHTQFTTGQYQPQNDQLHPNINSEMTNK